MEKQHSIVLTDSVKTYLIAFGAFFLLLVGTILLGIVLKGNNFFTKWDAQLYEFFHLYHHSKIIDWFIFPFNFNFIPHLPLMPTYLYLMVLPPLFYVWLQQRKQFWSLLAIFIAGAVLVHLVSLLDWQIINRARPFLTLPNNLDSSAYKIWEKLPTYPSGHTRDTALYATIIASFWPKWRWPLVVFTIFIIYSRVYIGAHYLTDSISGALIGYATAKIVLYVYKNIRREEVKKY